MKKMSEQAYAAYVKEKTPVHNVYANMAKAFVTGGGICLLGQVILNYCKSTGMKEEIAGAWTSLVLILLSVILTGVNIYPSIAKWGGAGALVPIQCDSDRSEYLSEHCKMGRCRGARSDYRICELSCGAGD